jgi:hypothetical protein
MHTWLRVTGVLPGLLVSVVLGLGCFGWAPAEAVDEPAGVVPVHPCGGQTQLRLAAAVGSPLRGECVGEAKFRGSVILTDPVTPTRVSGPVR